MMVKSEAQALASEAPGLDLAAESEEMLDTAALLGCVARDIDLLHEYGHIEPDVCVRLTRALDVTVARVNAQAARIASLCAASAAARGRDVNGV